MKIYPFLLILMVFLACRKSTFQSPQDIANDVNIRAIEQTLAEENIHSQKSLYYLLSKEEKFVLWTHRLKNAKTTLDITVEQRRYIDSLQTIMSYNTFDMLNSARCQKAFSGEREKMISLFGFEKTRDLFASLKLINTQKSIMRNLVGVEQGEIPPGSGDCDCSKSSDWCGIHGDCVRQGCNEGGRCGTLLLYTCDGDCF